MSDDAKGTVARIRALAAGREPRVERARAIAAEIRSYGRYRWVGLYDVEEAEVAIIGWSGGGPPEYPRFPRSHGLTSRAIACAESVIVNDVASDPDYLEAFGDTRAEAIVPVVVDGAVVGTIDAESGERDAFRSRDRAFLESCRVAVSLLWRDDATDEDSPAAW